MAELDLHPLSLDDEADLRSVIGLAKKHSRTLGFLPDRAFRDRVERGHLIVAKISDLVVGYCLFDLPRAGHIKLVHVCVDASARRSRVGKALIDTAIGLNPAAIGVLAYCRRDYGMDRFWESAGLSPRTERAGRSAGGSILSAWWRQLGALDLLEEAALVSGLPLVVYDTNVVSDLYTSRGINRPDGDASEGLRAGWLQAAITIAVSPRVDLELDGIEDAAERAAQKDGSQELIRLRSERPDDSTVLDELRERAGVAALSADDSLSDDLCHVADAIAAGADYVVTNDRSLLAVSQRVLPGYSELRVVRPHELVEALLETLNFPAFQSRLIESVDLEWMPASAVSEIELSRQFVNHAGSERERDFLRNLRAARSKSPQSARVLVDPRGLPWALIAERREDDHLAVDLFRVRRGEAATTTALQLARHLRSIARANGLHEVRVDDASLSTVCIEALEGDRFTKSDNSLVGRLIDEVLDVETLKGCGVGVAVDGPAQVRDVERSFWPLIVRRAEVPTFLIPIQPRYAEPLFGLDRSVLWQSERKRALGLSREHVYYSGARSSLPTRYARILWYVSSDKSGEERAVMAFSRAIGTERLSPRDAHARYSHVGVLRQKDVEAAIARDGKVTVVRFEDTEVLERPVGGRALRMILDAHGVNGTIQWFRTAPAGVFDDIVSYQPRRTT